MKEQVLKVGLMMVFLLEVYLLNLMYEQRMMVIENEMVMLYL
jgi:hypothetical protein